MNRRKSYGQVITLSLLPKMGNELALSGFSEISVNFMVRRQKFEKTSSQNEHNYEASWIDNDAIMIETHT